jgi:hypothetical protein
MKMVIRKSNVAHTSFLRATPTFHALAWVDFPANRRLAFVTLGHQSQAIKDFLQHDVIIDGASYFCVDVRTFTPEPHGKGDSIGLLVEGV